MTDIQCYTIVNSYFYRGGKSVLSKRLEAQIKVFQSIKGGVISDIDEYRQTVEDPNSLVLDPNNAKVHKAHDLEMIGHSLNAFGFRKNAISVQENTRIVYAGNGIVSWLIANEINVCPVLWIPESMTESEAKAYALMDNQSAELAEYDWTEILARLEDISDDFAPEELGFDTEVVTALFSEMGSVDDAIESMRKTKISSPSDVRNKSGLVKLLFMPSELADVERALKAANQPSRGEALSVICRAYLEGIDAEK